MFLIGWGVQVGVLGATLADFGFKLGVFGSSWGDVWACWRQDGRQEQQYGTQKRQDEPREATGRAMKVVRYSDQAFQAAEAEGGAAKGRL